MQHGLAASSSNRNLASCVLPEISISVLQDREISMARVPSRESLEYACNLSHASTPLKPEPRSPEFLASELGKAVDSLQNMQDKEPVIMNIEDADAVEVSNMTDPHQCPFPNLLIFLIRSGGRFSQITSWRRMQRLLFVADWGGWIRQSPDGWSAGALVI